MINANELRIGNWVLEGGITVKMGMVLDADYESLQSIPITTEILEKCGFEYFKDNNSYQLDSHLGFSLWGRNEISVYAENDKELGNSVKYLHQLQNLYFALTGKELHIEL